MKKLFSTSLFVLAFGLLFISADICQNADKNNSLHAGKNILSGYVTGFEICPHNPNTLYTGSLGAIFGNNGSEKETAKRGFFKSTDAGKNWKNIGSKDLQSIQALCVSEKDPNVVFASPGG